MKAPFILFAATACVSSTQAQITSSLQAYWNFEGNASNNPSAAGGTAFNGALIGNAATSGGAIKVGSGSLALDGSGDYMDVGTNVNINSPWSVSAWFRADAAPAGATRFAVYESVGTASTNGYGMSYGLRDGTTGNTNFQLFTDNTPATDGQGDFQISDASTANTWYHITTAFTPATASTAGSITGYLNGVQRYNVVIPANNTLIGSNGFHVGTYRNADGRWFDGAIDEVAIWNSTLTAGSAYTTYNLGDKSFALNTVTRIKDDNLTNLNAGGSWAGGSAPGSAEYLSFDNAFTQSGALDSGGVLSVAGIRVTSGSGLIHINNTGGYLELGALGVDMAGAARNLTIEDLRISASQRWNVASGSTFTAGASSSLSGAHTIDKWGSGTAVILSDNTFSGGTTITAGTLQIGNGTSTGNLGTGNVINNASLVFSRNNETSVTNQISGTGNLTQQGTGALVLTAANTFTGNTSVNSGSLRLANTLALQNSTLTAGAIEFDASVISNHFTLGGLAGSGNIVLQNNAGSPAAISLSVGNNNASTSFAGSLGGSGSLVKIGTGTLTLSGTSSHAGGLTIQQGRISATSASALGSGTITAGMDSHYGTSYASGGSPFLAISGTPDADVANDIVLPSPGSVRYYAIQKSGLGSNLTISGDISGGGTNMILQLDSPNGGDSTTNITLSGNNSFSGQVRLNRGAVILTNSNSLGTASLFVQSNANAGDGNIRFTNSVTLANNITFGSTPNNTINTGNNDVVISGVVTSSVAWAKVNGAGKLTVTGSNAISGAITISAGTLQIGNGGTAGTLGGSSEIINNAALAFNRSDDISTANIISGSGTLTQLGSGTLTLNSASTYSGSTTITDGTIALGAAGSINNSSVVLNNGEFNVSALSGGYTIGSGKSLTGIGAVTGDLTVDGGFAIGNSPGTMHFDGSLGLNGTADFELTNPTLALGSYDLATGTGDISFGGVLNLFFSGGTFADNASLQIFDFNGVYSGNFSAVNFTGLADGQSAAFDASTGIVTVVPEPDGALIGALGLILLLHRRR